MRDKVKNDKIVTIEALHLQSNDPHSQQISSSAPSLQVPTSTPERRDRHERRLHPSLQSALDKLGFNAADRSVAILQAPWRPHTSPHSLLRHEKCLHTGRVRGRAAVSGHPGRVNTAHPAWP